MKGTTTIGPANPDSSPTAKGWRRVSSKPDRTTLVALSISAALLLIVGAIFLLAAPHDDQRPPAFSDAEALSVDPKDPRILYLGLHTGVFRSASSGVTETKPLFDGFALSLTFASDGRLIAGGHRLLARADREASDWQALQPRGLPPSLMIDALASDPRSNTLFASLDGGGIFRSDDAGESWRGVAQAGSDVRALALLPDGSLVAATDERGVLIANPPGGSWRELLNVRAQGIAVNPDNLRVMLVGGPGILRTGDGGKHWAQVLDLETEIGPVAYAPSNSALAYAAGKNGAIYRSRDGGRRWKRVPTTR